MNCSLFADSGQSSANFPTQATNISSRLGINESPRASNKHLAKNMKDGEHSSEEASLDNSQEAGEIEKEAPVLDQEQETGVQGGGEDGGQEVRDVEVRSSEAECEEASPGQHNSSGYASDGSGEPGLQCNDQGPAGGQPQISLQSDPHQSAFRPAVQYPGQPMEPQAPEFQFRQNGGQAAPQGRGPEEMAAQGYGPPMGMMSHPGGPLTGHPMHTPIARRPITGNMSGYPGPPQAGYRPGPAHFPTSPSGPGVAPHNNTYRQAPAFNGGQMPGAGWGSPSWSGNGPPSGPPPISMTPPPLSWNQAPNRRPHNYQGGNKPFGNIQYGGQVMQQNPIRSKNYPFPSKALNPGKIRNTLKSVSTMVSIQMAWRICMLEVGDLWTI